MTFTSSLLGMTDHNEGKSMKNLNIQAILKQMVVQQHTYYTAPFMKACLL